MGVSVIDGFDGEGDFYMFFFEIDNCLFMFGDGGLFLFIGYVIGEGWWNVDDEKFEKFNLWFVDWNFVVLVEEVWLVKNLL